MHEYVHVNTQIMQTKHWKKVTNFLPFISNLTEHSARMRMCWRSALAHTIDGCCFWTSSTINNFWFDVRLCACVCVNEGWLNDILIFLVWSIPIYVNFMCVEYIFISFVEACAIQRTMNRVVVFSEAAAANTGNLSVYSRRNSNRMQE